MKKQDFFNNLADAMKRTNCSHMALPGNSNSELYHEMGVKFSNSTLILFHNNQIGHGDMLVCFDDRENVIAVKISNPSQGFLFAINLTGLLYGATIKSCEQTSWESHSLIIKLA